MPAADKCNLWRGSASVCRTGRARFVGPVRHSWPPPPLQAWLVPLPSAAPMSLSTVINAGLVVPPRPVRALVLMGGGARTAYQVGALKAIGSMLRMQPGPAAEFPFEVLVGTS